MEKLDTSTAASHQFLHYARRHFARLRRLCHLEPRDRLHQILQPLLRARSCKQSALLPAHDTVNACKADACRSPHLGWTDDRVVTWFSLRALIIDAALQEYQWTGTEHARVQWH